MSEIKIHFTLENANGTECGVAIEAVTQLQIELDTKMTNAVRTLDEAFERLEQLENDGALTEEIEKAEKVYLMAYQEYCAVEFQSKKVEEIKRLLEKLEYACLQYTWASEE